MLKHQFISDRFKVLKLLSTPTKFSKIIIQLKSALEEALFKIDRNDTDVLLQCKQHLLLLESDIDELYIDRIRYLELYLYSKYNADDKKYWFCSKGYEITDAELESLLKEEAFLNYIVSHRILENYDYYLLTKEESDDLIFMGESAIYLLAFEIKNIPELSSLRDFLIKFKDFPFLVIINKVLYNSIRKINRNYVFNPTYPSFRF